MSSRVGQVLKGVNVVVLGGGVIALSYSQHKNTQKLMSCIEGLRTQIETSDRRLATFEVLKEFDVHPLMPAAMEILNETNEITVPAVLTGGVTQKIRVTSSLLESALADAHPSTMSPQGKAVYDIVEQWIAYFNDLYGMIDRNEVNEEVVKKALIEWTTATRNNKFVYSHGANSRYNDKGELRYPDFVKLLDRWGVDTVTPDHKQESAL